jgi:hypothetical protein
MRHNWMLFGVIVQNRVEGIACRLGQHRTVQPFQQLDKTKTNSTKLFKFNSNFKFNLPCLYKTERVYAHEPPTPW